MTTLENHRITSPASYREAATFRRVWDWPTRLVHWGLAASILGAYVSNRLGASYFSLHLFFGYATIVLVVFRLIWGVVGTRHARFVNFLEGPRGVLRYVSAVGRKRRTRYAGHNPLGALMVITLLLVTGAQAALGLFGNDEIFNLGPFAGLVSKEASLFLTSLHRRLFYVIVFAVVFHIGAVLIHVFVNREPLILAMITGRKPADIVLPEEAIASSRSLLAILLFVALTAALIFSLDVAPQPDTDIASF
jgi:cytochrome b